MTLVALGSNLGDSQQTLREAMTRLRKLAHGEFLASSLYRSLPVDCPPGSPDFVNAAVAFEPVAGETPESLLRKLQQLEREFGRQPKRALNEARSLDLDLIAFGFERRDTPELCLPHPRAHLRAFVLVPLEEIIPAFRLPGHTRSVRALLAGLGGSRTLERLA